MRLGGVPLAVTKWVWRSSAMTRSNPCPWTTPQKDGPRSGGSFSTRQRGLATQLGCLAQATLASLRWDGRLNLDAAKFVRGDFLRARQKGFGLGY